ncbi:MAG: gamma-glutamyl kinase [Pseudomonadota bacterium]
MLISVRRKVAYLALPKTGTTAVEHALDGHVEMRFAGHPSIKHTNYRKYRRFILPFLEASAAKTDGIETCCVVREPVSWLRSWYTYRQRPEIDGKRNSTRGVTFAQFIEGWLAEDPPQYARVGLPSAFIADEDRTPGVDRLFRYENLSPFVAYLEDRFRAKLAFERINVSPRLDADLPAALLTRLETERAGEFELYGSIA